MLNGFGRKGFYNSQEIGLGRALVKAGHTVTIYKGIRKNEREETKEIENGLTVKYTRMKAFGAHGYPNVSQLDPHMDALLCFADNQIFLPVVYKYCLRNHIAFVPYVGTAHSLHTGAHAFIMDALFHMGTLRIYKRIPVIAKTMSACQELEDLGVKNVRIAPVGLDTKVLNENFKEENKSEIREDLDLEDDDVVLMNVSRLSPLKRVIELLHLLDRVRDKKKFKLILIGRGELEDEVASTIKELNLEKLVIWEKQVAYDDMWKYYVASDYFINMNETEIFGMAIMEAAFYEVSVAARKAIGPNLTLDGKKGHKLCATDEDIEKWICGTYPSREDLHESAEKLISEFSWSRCADIFIDIAKHTYEPKNKKNKKRK